MIGEHTDYNEGWVLPGASDLHLLFAGTPSSQPSIQIHAAHFDEEVILGLQDVPIRSDHWSRFPAAAIHTALAHKLPLQGLHILFDGNLPMGAGMSSSSALTCGLIFMMNHQFGWKLPTDQLIDLAIESEHRTGVRGGVMDQFAIFTSRPDHVQLLDCRTLESTYLSLPPDGPSWYIVDSGVQHDLVDSPYNQRREACDRITQLAQNEGFSVRALRDLTHNQLALLAPKANPADVEKAHFVLDENARVWRMVDVLKRRDWNLAGELIYQSHQGLRDLYRVSCPELDTIVETLMSSPGIHGARLMGAGFGGSVLVLGDHNRFEAAWVTLDEIYTYRHGIQFTSYPVHLDRGVHILA